MAFPNNVSAAIYSRFVMSATELSATQVDALDSKLDWAVNFTGSNTLVDLGNIRDMPSFGTPANIIKVPEFGRDQTLSIGAQPDAPDLEFTINFVGSDWDEEASATVVGDYVSDGRTRPMMISMLSSEASSSALRHVGGALNATIFFAGRIESALFNPMRDDASTVTVALSVQSNFFGPVTFDTASAADMASTSSYFDAFATSATPTRTSPGMTPGAGWTVGAPGNNYASYGFSAAAPYLFQVDHVSGTGGSTVWSLPRLVGVW